MTLAETYALATGVPLDKPEMVSAFFPLDTTMDKVILIHAFAGATVNQNGQIHASFPAKIYDRFNEVIDLLRPIVEPLGYKFFQIGGPGEPGLRNIESLVGKTNMHQCAYLVKNCALLIGNDSMWAHVRGAEKKPQTHLYSATASPHFPYWHHPDKAFFIESHRAGKKPSFAAVEHPKTINWITPEEVANAALRALDLPPTVTRKSLFFGDSYNVAAVELVPNCIVGPHVQIPGPLVVRMDYVDDVKSAEQILLSNLQIRPCLIITDKELDLNLLKQAKPRIAGLRVEIDKVTPEWVKQVKKLGIQTAFFCSEQDESKLAALRLAFYESCLFDHFQPPKKEDFVKGVSTYLNKPLDTLTIPDTLLFQTNKFLLSEGKVYLSKAHWKAGINTPTTEKNNGQVIDTEDFWSEVSHSYIYHE